MNDTFAYNQPPCGELIYGTKDELQMLGLGVDHPFPGEPGVPRRLMVTDPRDLRVKIEIADHFGEGCFSASILLPGRELDFEPVWQPFASGIERCEDLGVDSYRGSAENLIAAGLVRPGQFPGDPGMRKVCVTIYADGEVAGGSPKANCSNAKLPGAKRIERLGRRRFKVSIWLDDEEYRRRLEAHKAAEIRWELRVAALPRPAPLYAMTSAYREGIQAAALGREDRSFQRFLRATMTIGSNKL